MDLTQTALGTWSGGHFMHFGADVGREGLAALIRDAYHAGVRTFITADVYGEGQADALLGEVLQEFPRDSYCLVGAIGHDFYGTAREEGAFPRFTSPGLRTEDQYESYLRMAAEKSLERLRTEAFDLLMLHNPDWTGYSSETVWRGLERLLSEGLTQRLGVAPGPANGFTLDVIHCFERFGSLIDWAMLILNPLEPWPGNLALAAAEQHQVRVLTRVVDYGGLFLDAGLQPGVRLKRGDHRSFRPDGWVDAAWPKLERYRAIAAERGLTLLQLACLWNLGQPAVACVVPTLVQETTSDAKPLKEQVRELAAVPNLERLPVPVLDEMLALGDNRNCMALKGGNPQYTGEAVGDQWPLNPTLTEVGARWNIVPERDLTYADDPRDIREKGAAVDGVPQALDRRLYLNLHVFNGCRDVQALARQLEPCPLAHVLYADAHDPTGVGLLTLSEDPGALVDTAHALLASPPFSELTILPHLSMLGRTYSTGREPDLADWLLEKPRRNSLNPDWPWAIWYPLRRRGAFYRLPEAEQGKILYEHAVLGRTYGKAGYAADIRLACFGLDRADNEFVIGLLGKELYPLSRLIQAMRGTLQTAEYLESLGPFFVGKVVKQSVGASA